MAILAILTLVAILMWGMLFLLFGGTDDDDHDNWRGYT